MIVPMIRTKELVAAIRAELAAWQAADPHGSLGPDWWPQVNRWLDEMESGATGQPQTALSNLIYTITEFAPPAKPRTVAPSIAALEAYIPHSPAP